MVGRTEVWKTFEGLNGEFRTAYEISTEGQMRSIERIIVDRRGHKRHFNSRILQRSVNARGSYVAVYLSSNGRQATLSMAPAVLTAFVGRRPSPEHYVRYLDGDRTNCRLSNLRWICRGEMA